MTEKPKPLTAAQLEAFALDPDYAWLFTAEEIAVAAHKRAARTVQLNHKDYLTIKEAAEYCGISYSHFRATVLQDYPPMTFYGKRLYRRVDLQRLIESGKQWQQSTNAASRGISTGTTTKDSTASPLDKYRSRKRSRSGTKKESN